MSSQSSNNTKVKNKFDAFYYANTKKLEQGPKGGWAAKMERLNQLKNPSASVLLVKAKLLSR